MQTQNLRSNQNSIHALNPYKTEDGQWVFDDAARGLTAEPFVFGIPEMIETLLEQTGGLRDRFTMLVSSSPMPIVHAELEWVEEAAGGNWYWWPQEGLEGWLCPALYLFFAEAPKKIYICVQ